MNGFFAEHTLKMRHNVVRLIAPKLYKGFKEFEVHCAFPRPMIRFLSKNYEEKPLRGAEIGVARGVNAESILETLNIEKLFLIDPYVPYVGHFGRLQTEFVGGLPNVKKRLEKWMDRIVFMCETSEEAAEKILDGSLDFVYVDGNHSYSFVKKDIEQYWMKVKDGGVLGGHDFNSEYLDVSRAVIEFVNNHDFALHGLYFDWWIVKTSG